MSFALPVAGWPPAGSERPDMIDTSSPPARRIGDTFFRHIIAGMRNGVLAVTRDCHVAFINDEACRIFNLPHPPDETGAPLPTLLRAHPDVVRVLSTAFELNHLPNRAEMRLKPSGRVIGYTLGLVRGDDGGVVGAAMFFKDLTRVERLEERERLRDRLAALGEMAAVIAHEVKNPLAGIEVMAGLLRRKLGDTPDAQALLSDIIAEAKMANSIVQEVLEFVRQLHLHVERTSVRDAIQAAIQHADSKVARGAVDVAVRIADGLPDIQADQHQLTQLFTNLLMNAYEAMHGTGHVSVTADRVKLDELGEPRDAVRIEVADSGPGIPEDVAMKVFEPFFTTKPQGSGLGLAIVRKIVDAHDGRIDLPSHGGAGTTIRLTLPVTALDEDAQGFRGPERA
jgi:signal transduction histidine kinase